MELNEIKKQGKWTDISDTLNENFAKVNAETQRIELASRKNKGYFAKAGELIIKVPTALNGDIAYVGAKYPYNIYRWVDGAWVNSGEKGGEEVNNITNVTNIAGSIVNKPDDEDLVDNNGVLKLKDRDTSKGMGYVILRTDKTFAEQITQPNTVYEIRYDFDLGGAEVEIPENCVLKFEGGSLRSGIVFGSATTVTASQTKIFNGITLRGTWDCNRAYSSWFVHSEDNTNEIQWLFELAVKGIAVELEAITYNVTFDYKQPYTFYTYNETTEEYQYQTNNSAQFIAEGVDINIIGNNATIVENYNPTTHRLIQMFALKNCTGNITDIKVILTHPCDDTDDVNSLSVVHLVEGCHNMNISLEGENIRTPVEAGFFGWHRPSVSNSTIRTTNKGKGYGIVLYDGFNLKLDINVNKLHRGAYIAGVTNSDLSYKGGVIYETATALLLRDTRLIIHNDQLSYVMSDSLNINMSINDRDYESGTFKGVSAITMSGYTSDLFKDRIVRYNCTFNVNMTILLDKTNDVIPLYSGETDYLGDVYNVNIALSEYVNSPAAEQKTLINLSKDSGSSYNINIEGDTNTQKRCRIYNNGVVHLKVSRFAQPTGSNYMYFEVQNTNNKLRNIVCDSPNMFYYVTAVPDGYSPCCTIEKTLMAQNAELYMSEKAVSRCIFPSVVNTGFLNISKIQSTDIIQTLVSDGTNTCNFQQTSGSYIKFSNGTNVRVTILAVGNQSSYRMQGDIVTNLPNDTVSLLVPSIMHFTVQNNKLHLMDVQPIQGYSLSAGPTTNRPSGVGNGYLFFDTTIKKPIWWDSTAWVDATGATV